MNMPTGMFRTITVNEDTYNKLKKIAEMKGMSISKVVSLAVSKLEEEINDTHNSNIDEYTIKKIVEETIENKLHDILKKVLANMLK